MRLILTTFFLVCLNFGAFCQSVALEINESFKETPILEVFGLLKEKYQLKVAYDYESVKAIKITKNIRSKDLKNALITLFDNTNLEFKLTDDNRVLVRKVDKTNLSEAKPKIYQYKFTGSIRDIISQSPLAFATVFCPMTNEGCSTDEDGNFSLTVNTTETKGTISVQYLGYIPRKFSWEKGEQLTDLQITLQTKSLDFAEVTILEKLPTFQTNQADGSTVLNTSQLGKLPSFGGGNDIFRGLQLLPGISASDDLSSELKIRGSDGDENMIILDGITLYKVDHFYGIFSAINPSIVNQVKVFKNAFPVEYGGRTAGVIDLATHSVEEPKISGGLQADLLTTSAHVALPINNKMGLLFGGRITNQNVADTDLFDLIETSETLTNLQNNNNENNNEVSLTQRNPNFKLYDFNAKWIWQVGKRSNLSVSYFKGYDELNSDYEYQFDTKNTRGNRRDDIKNIETLEEYAMWDNQGASLQLNHQWNSKINTNINLAYSSYNDNQSINSTLVREINRRPPPPKPGMPPITIENTKIDTAFTLKNQFSNSITGAEVNIKNGWSISDKQQLTFGYHLIKNEVDYALAVDDFKPLNKSDEATQHSVYLQYNLRQFKKFNVGLGLRNTYYTLTNKNYLSPRLNLSYQASDNLLFKAACSKYYQFLRTNTREDRFGKTYDFWVLSNDNPKEFPIASSEQCMIGFNLKNDGFELDVEAYYKTIDGVTEFAPITNGFTVGEVATSSNKQFDFYNGTGKTKGIDVLLKKSAGKYTGWLSYTLSQTTHSFPQIDSGNPFPSQDDRRHQIKLVNQYRYKKFDFAATYIFSSGRSYTDLSKIEGQKDRDKLSAAERLSHLKDYARLDISAGYNFKIGDSKARFGTSVFNVLDRRNVKYKQYVRSVPNEKEDGKRLVNQITGIEWLMLGITPNVSFSIDF